MKTDEVTSQAANGRAGPGFVASEDPKKSVPAAQGLANRSGAGISAVVRVSELSRTAPTQRVAARAQRPPVVVPASMRGSSPIKVLQMFTLVGLGALALPKVWPLALLLVGAGLLSPLPQFPNMFALLRD